MYIIVVCCMHTCEQYNSCIETMLHIADIQLCKKYCFLLDIVMNVNCGY